MGERERATIAYHPVGVRAQGVRIDEFGNRDGINLICGCDENDIYQSGELKQPVPSYRTIGPGVANKDALQVELLSGVLRRATSEMARSEVDRERVGE